MIFTHVKFFLQADIYTPDNYTRTPKNLPDNEDCVVDKTVDDKRSKRKSRK